jgi:hypothetical protein
MVRAGWAFPRRDFTPYDAERFAELCAVEKEAREAKKGAWAGTFDIPFVQKDGSRDKVALVSCPEFPVTAISAADRVSKTDDDLPWLLRVLSALLTPAIAALAAVIAWAQWRAVRRREVMELFDRRLEIYEGISKVISEVVSSGTVLNETALAFARATSKIDLFFWARGEDIPEPHQ